MASLCRFNFFLQTQYIVILLFYPSVKKKIFCYNILLLRNNKKTLLLIILQFQLLEVAMTTYNIIIISTYLREVIFWSCLFVRLSVRRITYKVMENAHETCIRFVFRGKEQANFGVDPDYGPDPIYIHWADVSNH